MTLDDKLRRAMHAAAKTDPTMQRIIGRYKQAINRRLKILARHLAKKLHKEQRQEFRRAMKRAGVPVMPRATKRWSTDDVAALHDAIQEDCARKEQEKGKQ